MLFSTDRTWVAIVQPLTFEGQLPTKHSTESGRNS